MSPITSIRIGGLIIESSRVEHIKPTVLLDIFGVLNSEEQSNEYAFRPIEETSWHIIVLHETQPIERALISPAMFWDSQVKVVEHASLFNKHSSECCIVGSKNSWFQLPRGIR